MSYRQIFDDAIGQAPVSTVDVDRVVRRERRAAVLRPVLAAATVAVLAVAAGVTAATVVRSGEAVSPAAGTIAGFPEYHQGNRVVAAASGELSDGLEVTFTPTTEDLTLYWRCDTPAPWWHSIISVGDHEVLLQRVEFRVDGELLLSMEGDVACGSPSPDDAGAPDRWAATGVRVGAASTLTARIVGDVVDVDGTVTDPPGGSTWGVAVAEAVPFEEYPLPPRPESLPPLTVPEHGYHVLLLRSDPADPARPVSAPLEWLATGDYTVQVGAQTPGVLTVLVDGVEVGEVALWRYHEHCTGSGMPLDWAALADAGVAATPGDEVTVTVRPEHVTGDWYLRLNNAGHHYC